MEKIIRQSIGIDVSKQSFCACVCNRDLAGEITYSKVIEFGNNKSGFNAFQKWTRKNIQTSIEVVYVMEATGNNYENLAYFLYNQKQQVCVLLPNKVVHFAKSLNIKTKTDALDARVIGRLGVERKLSLWSPSPYIFKHLKELTRQYSDLQKEKTVFQNRLQALKTSHKPQTFIIRSNKAVIKTLSSQIESCKNEINGLLRSEEWLWQKVKKVLTIKGVGLTTIAIIIAETQGFRFVQNIRQLVSYAGLDVIQRESGTSVIGGQEYPKKETVEFGHFYIYQLFALLPTIRILKQNTRE